MRRKWWSCVPLCLVGCLLMSGCATPMVGEPSLTLLSRDVKASSPQVKVIGGEVEASDSVTWFLLFGVYGTQTMSHERAVNMLLEQHHADLLVDAQARTTVYGIPYIWMQFSATVRGRPAVFVKGGEK